MDSNRITQSSEGASSRYKMFLSSLDAIYNQFSSDKNPGSASVRTKASSQAYLVAQKYLSSEIEIINQILDREIQDATFYTLNKIGLNTVEPSQSIVDQVMQLSASLDHQIRTQLERDIEIMLKSLRNLALRSTLVASSRGISKQAALAWVKTTSDETRFFHYLDRASRRWPSEKLVRTLYRHALVLAWNETALLTMASSGISSASIEHTDDTYAELGTVVSLAEDPKEGVTYQQIRDEVFHPNSNAWLSPIIE